MTETVRRRTIGDRLLHLQDPMRIRDALQFGKNVVAGITLEVTPAGWPKIILKGENLWRLHENPMLAQQAISEGFIERRILWENFSHELKFVDQPEHRSVLTTSLQTLDNVLTASREKIRGASGEEAWLSEMMQYLSSKTRLALKRLMDVPTWQAYNKWNDEIDPIGEDERMTPDEETANLLEVVRDLRKETYWAWDSLIDFLNDGPIKAEARKKMVEGRASVGLVDADVEQNWVNAA